MHSYDMLLSQTLVFLTRSTDNIRSTKINVSHRKDCFGCKYDKN